MRIKIHALVITLIPIILIAASKTDNKKQDWSGWRGGYYSGSVNAPGKIPQNAGLELAWKRPLGSGYSAVTVAEGKVVTMFSDQEYDFIVALSEESGQELWRSKIDTTYPGHDGANDGPVSTPAIENGRVYAVGPRGQLLALDLKTGRRYWTTNLVKEHDAVAPHWGFTSSPLIFGNLVILATGGTKDNAIAAFDKETGNRLWAAGNDTINYQSPLPFKPDDHLQIVCGGDTYLYGLEPETGGLLWQTRHSGDGFYRRIINPVVVGKDKLFMTYRRQESKLVRIKKQGHKYAVEDLWTSKHLKLNYNIPVYHQGYIYGYSGRFLSCIDATTGDLLWKSRQPGDGFTILVDNHLIVMTKKGSLHLAKASPHGYEEVDRMELFDKLTWTPPSFANGRIYARSSFDEIASVAIGRRDPMVEMDRDRDRGLSIPDSKFAKFVAQVEMTDDKKTLLDEFMDQQKSFPLFEGDSLVHIVYRGEVQDLAIRGDMFDLTEEVSMRHIANTDFYYASFKFEPDAHLNYRFTRNFEDRLPDPLNQNKIRSIVISGDVSEIFMPLSSQPSYFSKYQSGTRGTIDTLDFKSEKQLVGGKFWGGRLRKLRIYLPPGYDESNTRYPVLYIHHGDVFLEAGQMRNVLDYHIGEKIIKPIIAVFVPSISAYEYARSQREVYAKMMVDRLVPLIDARYRTITKPSGRAILGGDEGGYSAYYIAFRYSGVFGHVAGQSVWPIADGLDKLMTLIKESDNTSIRLYLDWGKFDIRSTERDVNLTQIGEQLTHFLLQQGYEVDGGVTNNGSDLASWRLQWGQILESMFGLK